MTDLERVARAIFCAIWTPEMWDDKGFEIERQESFAEARAAIEALMEPSDYPVRAGVFAQFHGKTVAETFNAMLRAVLEGR